MHEGIGAPRGRELARMSWLEFALNPFPDLFGMPPGGVSSKVKDALRFSIWHARRGPDAEYVRRALVHALLQGELPASAADQGTLGPARCVPACVVHSGGRMSI